MNILPNSCICSQSVVATDERVEFCHECWLMFSFVVTSETKVKQ